MGLFLLAPGLAGFAGLYHGSKLGRVEAPPPPPGSILALSIVTGGALLAHLIGALAFWLQDAVCGRLACLRVGYEPNIYAALFNVALARGEVTGTQVVVILFDLALLTAIAFRGARAAFGLAGDRALKGMLYGWLADVDVGEDADEAVLAYVVSDIQQDGTVVGYEGVVANMTTNAEKEITSILLDSCEIFYLRVSENGVSRRNAARDSEIGQLYLDRAHIRNVAFERVMFADEDTRSS
jgi:hypothetical protein